MSSLSIAFWLKSETWRDFSFDKAEHNKIQSIFFKASKKRDCRAESAKMDRLYLKDTENTKISRLPS
jgi:hypothetical protein